MFIYKDLACSRVCGGALVSQLSITLARVSPCGFLLLRLPGWSRPHRRAVALRGAVSNKVFGCEGPVSAQLVGRVGGGRRAGAGRRRSRGTAQSRGRGGHVARRFSQLRVTWARPRSEPGLVTGAGFGRRGAPAPLAPDRAHDARRAGRGGSSGAPVH